MGRVSWLVAASFAITVGCSLAIDTSDLSTEASSAPVGSDAGEGTSGETGSAPAPGEDAEVDGSASNGCPAGRGPAMIRVTDEFGTFCVDATEVTNAQFDAFLSDSNRPAPPSACGFKTSYGGPPRPTDNKPVSDVDWCDAWMFCAWAGKRLCSSRNGVKIADFAPANDPAVSEWYAACSRSDARPFPYGGSYEKASCNGCERTNACGGAGSPVVEVGSLATCEGGYPGLFDMTGNVAEWEDDCEQGGDSATCPARGGGFKGDGQTVKCTLVDGPWFTTRGEKGPDIGIRCCAN